MDSVIYKRGVSRKTWFTPKKLTFSVVSDILLTDIASRLALLVKGVMLYDEIRKNFDMYRPCALHFYHKRALTARLAPSG